jgi:hypothetical protein
VVAVLGERGSVTEGVQGGRERERESERGQVMRGRLYGEVLVEVEVLVSTLVVCRREEHE